MNLKSTLKLLKMNEPLISTILGALVVLTIGVLLVNYFRAKGPAPTLGPATQTEKSPDMVALPTTHTVQRGEHLWKISEQYYKSGFNWVDIADANNLTNPNTLNEGVEITIPQVEAKTQTVDTQEMAQAPPATATMTPDLTMMQQDASQAITGYSYKVVTGDSLWKVAVRAYGDGYRWTELAKVNSLQNPDLIYPDQELKLLR